MNTAPEERVTFVLNSIAINYTAICNRPEPYPVSSYNTLVKQGITFSDFNCITKKKIFKRRHIIWIIAYAGKLKIYLWIYTIQQYEI